MKQKWSGLLVVFLGVIATACATTTTPTPTPTPRPPVQGIRTPEDMRGKFEAWPEEYKFAIDDDVVVRFAYPSDFIDFSGAAYINHIPSVSTVVLYTAFSAETRRSYKNDEGRARLEAILADEALMQTIEARIPNRWKKPARIITRAEDA